MIPSRVLRNFQVAYSFCLCSVALQSTQPSEKTSFRNSHGVKVWLVHRADNSAILVVPPVKVRMEAQHSIFPSVHDLLWESFTFTLTSSVSSLLIIYKYEDKVSITHTHTHTHTHTVLYRTH